MLALFRSMLIGERSNSHWFCLQGTRNQLEWSRSITVWYATGELGPVTQANDHVYIVALARKQYTYKQFQENDIPGGHAFDFILALGESPKSYLPVTFQNQLGRQLMNEISLQLS